MTDIFIDPTKSNIAVQITSQSLHALGFEITVFGTDGSTIIEHFTGDTESNKSFTKILENKPSASKGYYIRGTFTVISPDGKDYPYSILFSILEDKMVIKPNITLSDTTTAGKDTTGATYHIN